VRRLPPPEWEAPIKETPLPVTLTFVLCVGGLIGVGWIAMFVLLMQRW
jgi:hypothetical protein